ncbi:MAG: type II toxin-antitoxin system RatA family toxin [Gammaproteobacteria bacterium]|nr:type II toxin-antitoxin system RatA family toxin [Gammaproteobacteria bacterium]
MPHVQRSALVPHAAQTMYELVADVERYAEFLPWCGGGSILESSEVQQLASVSIRKGPINTAFTTRNQLQAPEKITLELVDGPFRQLEGQWLFRSLADAACKVELELQFEFVSGPTGLLLRPVFNHIADTLVSAFVERANQLHAVR